MAERVAIYVSSAGRRVELIRCFRESAQELGVEAFIVAGDVAPEFSAACIEADLALRTPRCDAPDFPAFIADMCMEQRVSLIVPTIDTELLVFSELRGALAQHGTTVGVSTPEVIRLARDKLATAHWIGEAGLGAPVTTTLHDLLADPGRLEWPLLVKPRSGSSSKGIYIAHSIADIRAHPEDDHIAQMLLTGVEYTVNVFFDKNGQMRSAVPHVRHEVRGGEVSKGETTDHPALLEAAERLRQLQGARGALCFQAIMDRRNEPAIFEINARFGGGYPLAHRAGAPFTTWLLAEALGRPVSYEHKWKSGVRMLRYDAAMFTG